MWWLFRVPHSGTNCTRVCKKSGSQLFPAHPKHWNYDTHAENTLHSRGSATPIFVQPFLSPLFTARAYILSLSLRRYPRSRGDMSYMPVKSKSRNNKWRRQQPLYCFYPRTIWTKAVKNELQKTCHLHPRMWNARCAHIHMVSCQATNKSPVYFCLTQHLGYSVSKSARYWSYCCVWPKSFYAATFFFVPAQ